jgi:hypothetical protein
MGDARRAASDGSRGSAHVRNPVADGGGIISDAANVKERQRWHGLVQIISAVLPEPTRVMHCKFDLHAVL